jgi:hypothetical protein
MMFLIQASYGLLTRPSTVSPHSADAGLCRDEQNCAADIFFSCWQNNANKVATTTIAIIDGMFNNN